MLCGNLTINCFQSSLKSKLLYVGALSLESVTTMLYPFIASLVPVLPHLFFCLFLCNLELLRDSFYSFFHGNIEFLHCLYCSSNHSTLYSLLSSLLYSLFSSQLYSIIIQFIQCLTHIHRLLSLYPFHVFF